MYTAALPGHRRKHLSKHIDLDSFPVQDLPDHQLLLIVVHEHCIEHKGGEDIFSILVIIFDVLHCHWASLNLQNITMLILLLIYSYDLLTDTSSMLSKFRVCNLSTKSF